MKNSKLMIVLRGIIMENPVLILVLGTCPTLATTNSLLSALSMGIAATLVLICSNAVISALRSIIPETVRIPCYIVIIAGFVTAADAAAGVFALDLRDARCIPCAYRSKLHHSRPRRNVCSQEYRARFDS